MTQLATTNPDMQGLEDVLLSGDLGALNPYQRVAYYQRVCESVGLNPLTQPFEYLRLNGKTILYARRAATEQLRRMHNVSITILDKQVVEGCYVVTARATLPSGRTDEDVGSVPIQGLKGEALSNAWMKAITKAKRRVTLAICGLAFLDETEAESLPGAERVPMPAQPQPAPQLAEVVPIQVTKAAVDYAAATMAEKMDRALEGPLEPSEEATARELVSKLEQCRTPDEFVQWMRELFAANLTDAGIKRKLWTMCVLRCKAHEQDANILAKEAKKPKTKLETQLEASIAQAEVTRG